MLHIFNRTNVYTTYSIANLDKVKKILDLENVDYMIRTTKSNNGFEELGSAYQLYVHQDATEETQRLIHEALFPDDDRS